MIEHVLRRLPDCPNDLGINRLGLDDGLPQRAGTTARIQNLVVGSYEKQKERPDAGGLQGHAKAALAYRNSERLVGSSVSCQKDVGQRRLALSSPDDTQDSQPYGSQLGQHPIAASAVGVCQLIDRLN